LPLDATDKFSSAVLPYIRQLLEPSSSSSPEIAAALERATLARNGKLEKQHEWLLELVEEKKVGMGREKRQRAVVLGAGYELMAFFFGLTQLTEAFLQLRAVSSQVQL